MTAALPDPPIPSVKIPDPECVRRRLAVLLTEADLLRAQLRVSARSERERDRLRRLLSTPSPAGGNDV